jgi:ABC-type Fe3+-siderophore transport system permease subunit
MMKTRFRGSLPIVVILVLLFVSSCVSVGGVFQSGFWVGIVLAVIAVVLVIWLVSKMRGGGGSSSTGSSQV